MIAKARRQVLARNGNAFRDKFLDNSVGTLSTNKGGSSLSSTTGVSGGAVVVGGSSSFYHPPPGQYQDKRYYPGTHDHHQRGGPQQQSYHGRLTVHERARMVSSHQVVPLPPSTWSWSSTT